jgi:hypothetical protein
MKKSLLLLLLPALIFTSCNKDSDELSEITEAKLKGSWKGTSSKYEYYDANGAKLYEEDAVITNFTFDGASTLTTSYAKGSITESYVITKDGSVEFLKVTSIGDSQKYKIEAISNTNLILSLETLNDVYYIGTLRNTAAKSLLRRTLVNNNSHTQKYLGPIQLYTYKIKRPINA